MNIIETVKTILSSYDKISEFTNGVAVDFINNTPTNFSLSPIGDELIKEDLLGKQFRRHSFILYANQQSVTDFDRLNNSGFLLELGYYLETVNGNIFTVEINGETRTGELKKLSSAKGMLFSIPTGNVNNGITYQLQIFAEYILEGEKS